MLQRQLPTLFAHGTLVALGLILLGSVKLAGAARLPLRAAVGLLAVRRQPGRAAPVRRALGRGRRLAVRLAVRRPRRRDPRRAALVPPGVHRDGRRRSSGRWRRRPASPAAASIRRRRRRARLTWPLGGLRRTSATPSARVVPRAGHRCRARCRAQCQGRRPPRRFRARFRHRSSRDRCGSGGDSGAVPEPDSGAVPESGTGVNAPLCACRHGVVTGCARVVTVGRAPATRRGGGWRARGSSRPAPPPCTTRPASGS